MRRFFFDPALRDGDSVEFGEGESRHISRVLRLPAGTEVELIDGSGVVYRAVINAPAKRVRATIVGIVPVGSVKMPLIVGQGLLKGKKMDTVIQKCTELGVKRFMPFWSSRCQGKLTDSEGQRKHQRQLRIVESASKQCYRPDLMELDHIRRFPEILSQFSASHETLRLLFWEEEKECSLHDLIIPADIDSVAMLLGPEGGLSREEVEDARTGGWQTVSLGKNILRAETATLTAVSIMQFLLKNI